MQKAIQSSLSGASVVNTLLQRPEQRDLARRFYRESLAEASVRHRDWARGHYARVASSRPTRFWQERAEAAPPPEVAAPELGGAASSRRAAATVAAWEIVEAPCVVDGSLNCDPRSVPRPCTAPWPTSGVWNWSRFSGVCGTE